MRQAQFLLQVCEQFDDQTKDGQKIPN